MENYPPQLIEEFLRLSETLFVISIVFLIVAILLHISLESIRKDFGEVTRAPLWKRVPGAIGGVLFSIFALIFMISRTGHVWVALISGSVAISLFCGGAVLNNYILPKSAAKVDSSEEVSTRKKGIRSSGAKASDKMHKSIPKRKSRKLSDNQVVVYILCSLSIISKYSFVIYAIISIIFNPILIYVQIQDLYYMSLVETLRLWDILITAISAIAIVVFGIRLFIEITVQRNETTGNEIVVAIKKRLMQ